MELNASHVDEDLVEQVFDLVESSGLPTDVKQSFSQRRQEFLEDFCSDVKKIRQAQEAHARVYKVKTGGVFVGGKRRLTEER